MKTVILVINIVCAVFVIGLTVANVRFESEKARIPLNICNLIVFSVLVLCAVAHVSRGKEFVLFVFILYFYSEYWRRGLIAAEKSREHDRLLSSKTYSQKRIADLEKELKESEDQQRALFDELRELHNELYKYREREKNLRGDRDAHLQNQ